MSPKGPDRDVDVIASPDGLGLTQPRIKAEVKHRDGSMDAPAKEALPPHLYKMLTKNKRGPQKAPTKTPVNIRLSEVVLAHYRSTGAGWQTRLDNDLKKLHHL